MYQCHFTISQDRPHPQAILTEYLRLGPHGGIGSTRRNRLEAGPMSPVRNVYRTDERSDFSARLLLEHDMGWNTAIVEFEGVRRTMLWGQFWHTTNWHATALLRQSCTEFVFGDPLAKHSVALSDAYVVLNHIHKPYIDVPTSVRDPVEFEATARPVFPDDHWWCAIPNKGGWRIFADGSTQLVFAKLALSD
jgi:hypothetical protein